jgi:Phage Tail Collar Domain
MNTLGRSVRGALVLALLLAVSQSALAAAVPATVGYQGRLYDQNGNPISGTLSVVFSLYPAASAGTAVWTETQSVTFADGYFTAQLGSVTAFPASTFNGSVLYLGVKVGTDAEMTPRASVASVPYALAAPPDARFGANTGTAVAGSGGAQCTLGEVILTAGKTANAALLPADGRLLSISSYAPLFSLLGTMYGGDGVSTFALPDLRSAAPNGLSYGICNAGVFP